MGAQSRLLEIVVLIALGIPSATAAKNRPANAGDGGDGGSILGQENPLL